MGMLIKGILAMVWLVIVPAMAGIPFTGKKKPGLPEVMLGGYMILFSGMEVMALSATFLKLPLHVLTLIYGVFASVLAVGGIVFLVRKKDDFCTSIKSMGRPSIYFWMAVLIIVFQVIMCVAMAHMDADDCFYVAAATTNVHTDSIFAFDPYTGCEYRLLPKRYVLSPFPVFLAVVSQLSGGLHPAIMAHMIFPAVFLPLAYMVQTILAKVWFPEERKARDIYVLLAACIASFSAYSVYNAGNFQMVRIWQGKAVLASVLLPYLIYLCIQIFFEKKQEISWMPFILAQISCCLLSSMGIILAPLLTLCFLSISLIWRRDWKRIAIGAFCCLPSIILGIAYIMMG